MRLPRIPWPNIGAIWRALLSAAPLKTWAIMLGGPALTLVILHGLTMLERAIYAQEPVRLEVVGHVADILKLLTVLVGVIVVSLAAVNAKVSTVAGSLEIDGDDRDERDGTVE